MRKIKTPKSGSKAAAPKGLIRGETGLRYALNKENNQSIWARGWKESRIQIGSKTDPPRRERHTVNM